MRAPAVRALVVAVLDQRDGASAGPAAVIAGADGQVQHGCHRCVMPSCRPPVRQRLERVEDAVGAGIHADRREVAPADDAVAVDHEQRALGEAVLLAIHAVAPRHVALGLEVGEQRKLELAASRERAMAPRAVDRDAEQLGVVFRELVRHLVVERHLIAADRAPVGGIEREHDRPAAKIRELDRLVGRGMELEIGRRRAHGSE